MLFLLERIPESLNLMIGFQIGIGLCIFETKLLQCYDQIVEKQGRHTFSLLVRPYSYKKHIESVRLFQEHSLEQMPPTERKNLTVTFLKCL